MRTLAVIAVAAGLLSAVQDSGKKPEKRKLADRQWIEGKIVCVGCALENQEGGADAQCTLHAKHAQGLQTADGTLWTFVANDKGHRVITNEKLRGKDVRVFGWKFPKAQYVEAFKYSVKEGEKWVAYDFCKNWGFEPGDNADRDVCDDCKDK